MGNQHASRSFRDFTLIRLVLIKNLRHDAGASRHHEQFTPEAQEGTGGDVKFHSNGPDGADLHFFEFRLAAAQGFDDCALVARVDFNDDFFHRFQLDAIHFFQNHFGGRDLQLEPFPAHGFN